MIIIADSSALVALSICDGLHLLDDLFGVLKVPQAVYDEVCVMHKAESHALQFYLQSKVCDVSSVISFEKSNGLGKGKLEPLIYTKNSQPDLLLIDNALAKNVAYQKSVNKYYYYRGINMNTQSVRQYADVENGFLHIKLPHNFDAKRVELTIVPLEEETTQLSNFQQFLLDSPEMSDEEFQSIREKREHLNQWK